MFLLIDKPVGPTSHDVIARLRRLTGIKKIGHAGTLDPFASGLLIVAVGRESTKQLDKFLKLDKNYEVTAQLGQTSTTGDPEGEITKNENVAPPSLDDIKKALQSFVGAQQQIPPMFSAKKIAGQKLYHLARAGKTVERLPQDIFIYEIKLKKYDWPTVVFEVKVSSGTYIRTLVEDIGKKLNCGAYTTDLRRTAIDIQTIDAATKLDGITADNWRDATVAL